MSREVFCPGFGRQAAGRGGLSLCRAAFSPWTAWGSPQVCSKKQQNKARRGKWKTAAKGCQKQSPASYAEYDWRILISSYGAAWTYEQSERKPTVCRHWRNTRDTSKREPTASPEYLLVERTRMSRPSEARYSIF